MLDLSITFPRLDFFRIVNKLAILYQIPYKMMFFLYIFVVSKHNDNQWLQFIHFIWIGILFLILPDPVPVLDPKTINKTQFFSNLRQKLSNW